MNPAMRPQGGSVRLTVRVSMVGVRSYECVSVCVGFPPLPMAGLCRGAHAQWRPPSWRGRTCLLRDSSPFLRASHLAPKHTSHATVAWCPSLLPPSGYFIIYADINL